MRSFSALASFAALTLIVLKVEVLASPIHSSQESTDDSTKISSREPVLPGTSGGLAAEHLLIRDNAYGWDHPHWRHHGGYQRRDDADLDDTVDSVDNVKRADSYGWDHRHWHKYGGYYRRELEVADTKSDGQYYGPHHHFDHWRHHHFFPRDDASIDIPQNEAESGNIADGGYYHPYHHRKGYYRRSDTDFESASATLDQTTRAEGYGRRRHHQKIYYRRGDIEDDAGLLSLDEDKREEGYGRHRHHKGYGYHRRRRDTDDSLFESDQEKREEGYYRHRYRPENHWRRDEAGSFDERDESVDEHHRHHQHKYPRDDAHHGWRWRHHRKFFHREDMNDLPSELDVESMVERDVGYRRPYYRRPRELVIETDSEGHPKKNTAEDVEDGVAHGLATGAKETAGGILGLDL